MLTGFHRTRGGPTATTSRANSADKKTSVSMIAIGAPGQRWLPSPKLSSERGYAPRQLPARAELQRLGADGDRVGVGCTDVQVDQVAAVHLDRAVGSGEGDVVVGSPQQVADHGFEPQGLVQQRQSGVSVAGSEAVQQRRVVEQSARRPR